MNVWTGLDEELSRWRDAGGVATAWWRDDDAVDATPALDRLLDLRARHDVGLALAAIPAEATTALGDRLRGEASSVAVFQHGYAHQNHALAPEKSVELGPHRPAAMVLGELGTGAMAMERLFGPRARPVLVPPWNRIAPMLVPALPEIGLRGLSTFAPRTRINPVRGLLQVNTHVDPVDWRGDRGFLGDETVIGTLVGHLAMRRLAGLQSAAGGEPTGLLTHHRVATNAIWEFMDRLLERLRAHSGARILAPDEVFAPS